jgi:photosystem II stability/assembly factor-like uncharacterized protein
VARRLRLTHRHQPKYLLAMLVASLLLAGCTNANWRAVEPHYMSDSAPVRYNWRNLTADLYSVYGTGDGKTLWAVGAGGTILHSVDDATWRPQASGTTHILYSVYGTGDGKTLWAVGAGGTILHSVDGATWQPQASGTRSALRSVYGTGDGKTLWAVGDRGTILHSTDGATWQAQASGTGNALFLVYGAREGKSLWVVGVGAILHSTDGAVWQPRTSGTEKRPFSSVYGSHDGKTLWAVGLDGTILHSTDGAAWERQASGAYALFSVYGTGDGKRLWAGGGHGTILHSTDGSTWQPQTSGTTSALRSVYGTADGKKLWAVGDRGTILHSTDGTTWQQQTSGTNILRSVYGTGDGKKLWAVGDGGTIVQSTNGAAWQPQISGTTNSLYSVYGTAGGKSLWAVGQKGTILHSTDGATWQAQTSGTTNDLVSVYGTGAGKTLWAVVYNGTILHSTDGTAWQPQTSGTDILRSVYGTGDGKKLWAVGDGGLIVQSTNGAAWQQQTSGTPSQILSVYGIGDGKALWAVGQEGTILHSTDGATWQAQTSGTRKGLYSVYGTGDGKTLWAVGDDGTILHSTDGATWNPQISSITNHLYSVYGTGDGKTLWAVGEGGMIVKATEAGRDLFINQARIQQEFPKPPSLQLQLVCDGAYSGTASLEVSARNKFKFKNGRPGYSIPYKGLWHPQSCSFDPVPFNPDDLEVGSGNEVYFDITLKTDSEEQLFTVDAPYDPWHWFKKHEALLSGAAVVAAILTSLVAMLYLKPLWNLKLYRALKLAKIETLSGIPLIGGPLQIALKTLTVLPRIVTHPRTLDAWVSSQRGSVAQAWEAATLPGTCGDPLLQEIASTPYIPLPLRQGDAQSGPEIPEPSASDVGALLSSARTVLEIVGPGGAGKTTLARQVGRWALRAGLPGGFSGHAMMPVWIDEDLDPTTNALAKVVKEKLAAILPEEDLDDEFLRAMLRKQRILVILDRLSERSAATQQYVQRIYRSVRAEALVITTRTVLHPEGSVPQLLYPQPLDESNLLRFMTNLVKEGTDRAAGPPDYGGPAVAAPLSSMDDQLALGHRLRDLFQATSAASGNQAPIVPLPVRLFVEDGKRLIREGRPLDQLPLSIPEVYFRYLEQVNPNQPQVPNFMTNPEMRKAAMLLAKLALGGDFIPKEFFRDDAMGVLKENGWAEPQKLDPVQRLIDNFILREKTAAGFSRLRFELDPIAENLAAAHYVRTCGRDAECLKKLKNEAAKAPGFLAAVELFGSDMR